MDFTKRTTWIAAASLALSACATTPPPEYAKDHPANPDAPAAAVQSASSTLATYRSFTNESRRSDSRSLPSEPTPKESGHEHQH